MPTGAPAAASSRRGSASRPAAGGRGGSGRRSRPAGPELAAGLPQVRAVAGDVASTGDATVVVLLARKADGDEASPAVLAGARETERRFDLVLADELAHLRAKGEVGSVVEIPVSSPDDPVERVLVVGAGSADDLGLRRAGAAAARRLRGVGQAAIVVGALSRTGLRGLVEGLLLGAYQVPKIGTERGEREVAVARVDVITSGGGADGAGRAEDVVRRAAVTARAVHVARDLANIPSSIKDPAWLAAQAERLGAQAGLEVRVRAEDELRAEGFNGVLAVGMGSVRPPRLIELTYTPEGAGPRTPHVVLVGKGITFDTGGLSLKRPYDHMLAMKTDMAAGGAVIATMTVLRELDVPVRVTGLVPAAENMPGAAAQRPGDVIRHYGGRTSEVLNTDAEGRLVLADALAYADAELDPDVIVDLATLTGAASLGLGKRHGALYTGDDRLAAALEQAGQDSGDRLWRMPLVEDYRHALDSDVADVAHVSRDPHIMGGSITAALFLREFVGQRRWAHLDIAGPARADADEHEVSKGATGFGVRVLLRWLESYRRGR